MTHVTQEPLSPPHSDGLVLALIQQLASQLPEERYCDKLIARLTDARVQVRAHLACGKLKAAYLLAVKLADLELIRALLVEAERVQSKNVAALCLKYLESRGAGPSATTSEAK